MTFWPFRLKRGRIFGVAFEEECQFEGEFTYCFFFYFMLIELVLFLNNILIMSLLHKLLNTLVYFFNSWLVYVTKF